MIMFLKDSEYMIECYAFGDELWVHDWMCYVFVNLNFI